MCVLLSVRPVNQACIATSLWRNFRGLKVHSLSATKAGQAYACNHRHPRRCGQLPADRLSLSDNSNCDPNTGIIIRDRSYWENPAELENSLTAMLEELSTESTL